MKQTDILTMQAFLYTLSQLESPLPQDVQQQIKQTSVNQKNLDWDSLIKIATNSECLKDLFLKTRTSLVANYDTEARNNDKLLEIKISKSNGGNHNHEIDNFSLPRDSLQVFTKILKSDDSQKMVKEILSQQEPDGSQHQEPNSPTNTLTRIKKYFQPL